MAGNLCAAIVIHARAGDVGVVLAAETGFRLFSNPDTVRAADVAFIRRERIPDPAPIGYAAMAPDLVVEVLSPDDRPGEVREKVADWLRAGSELVWVVDPIKRRARVHRADGTDTTIGADDALDGEAVLPGFTCRLSTVL